MEYTTLGKTGLRVSRMGFGGIPIQKVDASVTRKLMERLAECGVNYIDTARGYTVSESFLGEALEGGLREKFVLATKSMSRTKEAMAQDIETSLHNLRTDYIITRPSRSWNRWPRPAARWKPCWRLKRRAESAISA